MSDNTSIEWTDATINFWHGCTKVSAGKGIPRYNRVEKAKEEAIKLNAKAEREGRRYKVFANSMSDWLDDEVPIEWLGELLQTITRTPNLDWQLLTKRPDLYYERMDDLKLCLKYTSICVEWQYIIPANVWVGTTVENSVVAKERIPNLVKIPAKVRFLSCEPLLEEINSDELGYYSRHIHWIICGGESGSKVRFFNPMWAEQLLSISKILNIPFFMKQMGGRTKKELQDIPEDLKIREYPV